MLADSCKAKTDLLSDGYKHGGHEHVAIPGHAEQQFTVTEPNLLWRGDVDRERQTPGISCRCSRPVLKKVSRVGSVVPARQQTH